MGLADARNSCDEILSLAPDCDPSVLRFSPAEGYLFSRVDGYTPWRLLREMGGLPADEVDLCLENWLARGILLAEPAPDRAESYTPSAEAAPEAAPATPAASELPPIDSSLIDDKLDLSKAVQRQILEFEVGLCRNSFELLGLGTDADRRAVKKAYFAKCREFHPDRYFRRDIGPYTKKLEAIFKSVQKAYELLCDDDERAALAETLGPIEAPGDGESRGVSDSPSGSHSDLDSASGASSPSKASRSTKAEPDEAKPAQPILSPLDRLKQRMPFRIKSEKRSEGREQAEDFYQSALLSVRQGNKSEAIASLHLALAFDTGNKRFREMLDTLQDEATDLRLCDLQARADKMDVAERVEAMQVCEKLLVERAEDPEVHHLAARLSIGSSAFEKALDWAERAVELNPKVGRYHATLGQVFEGLIDWGHAISELKEAMRLDPGDEDSSRRLASLKWRARSKS